MKKLSENTLVDLDAEVNAMVRYVVRRWDNTPDLPSLFGRIAEEVAGAGRWWLDDTPLTLWVFDELKKRERQLEATYGSAIAKEMRYFDAAQSLLQGLAMTSSTLFRVISDQNRRSSDFETRVNRLVTMMKKEFPGLAKAKPHGWLALSKGYTDYDGMTEYCDEHQTSDEDEFDGHDTASPCSHEFPAAVALPYVMYSDKGQGRSSAVTLVGSVYSQLMAMQRHNALVQLRKDIVDSGITSAPAEFLLEYEAKPTSPLTKIMFELATGDRIFGVPAGKMDEAKQLLATCKASGNFEGLGKALMTLCASGEPSTGSRKSLEVRAKEALKALD